MKAKMPVQETIPGVLSAAEIIRAHYSHLGRMGGRVRSERKRVACQRTIRLAIAARAAQRKLERERKGHD